MVLSYKHTKRICLDCESSTTKSVIRQTSNGRNRILYLWHNIGKGNHICDKCYFKRIELKQNKVPNPINIKISYS